MRLFSTRILGDGFAVIPEEGVVYAPVDGVVASLFPTGHAVGLRTDEGLEVLIHIGLDTVQTGGKYFETAVKADQRVKKGDVLVRFDLEALKQNYDMITPVLVLNQGSHIEMDRTTGDRVSYGQKILDVTYQREGGNS